MKKMLLLCSAAMTALFGWATAPTQEHVTTVAQTLVGETLQGILPGRTVEAAERVALEDGLGVWAVKLAPSGHLVLADSTKYRPLISFSEYDFVSPEKDTPHYASLLAAAQRVAAAEAAEGEDNAAWTVNPYAASFLATTGTPDSNSITAQPIDTTSWYQFNALAWYTPGTAPNGCVATAQSQAMHGLQWPVYAERFFDTDLNYTDSSSVVTTENYRFTPYSKLDYSKMANAYEDLVDNTANNHQVARLALMNDIISKMDFAHDVSTTTVPPATVTPWMTNLDKRTRTGVGVAFTTDDKAAIKTAMEAGFPVVCNTTTHAVMASGYATIGDVPYVRINYGYNNSETAWYSLDDNNVLTFAITNPTKAVQCDPLPAITSASPTISWHIPKCYAGDYTTDVTGFSVKAVPVTAAAADWTCSDFTAGAIAGNTKCISVTKDGVVVQMGAQTAYNYPHIYYTLDPLFIPTENSVWNTTYTQDLLTNNSEKISLQVLPLGGAWETVATIAYSQTTGNPSAVSLAKYAGKPCKLRYFISALNNSKTFEATAVSVTATQFVDKNSSTTVTGDLEPDGKDIVSSFSRQFFDLTAGEDYVFAVTPTFSDSTTGVTGYCYTRIADGSTYVEEDFATFEVTSPSTEAQSNANMQIADGFFRYCTYDGTSYIRVNAGENAKTLEVYSSHLTAFPDDAFTVTEHGNGIFDIVVDGSKTAATPRVNDRVNLSLVATTDAGTISSHELSLAFTTDEKLAVAESEPDEPVVAGLPKPVLLLNFCTPGDGTPVGAPWIAFANGTGNGPNASYSADGTSTAGVSYNLSMNSGKLWFNALSTTMGGTSYANPDGSQTYTSIWEECAATLGLDSIPESCLTTSGYNGASGTQTITISDLNPNAYYTLYLVGGGGGKKFNVRVTECGTSESPVISFATSATNAYTKVTNLNQTQSGTDLCVMRVHNLVPTAEGTLTITEGGYNVYSTAFIALAETEYVETPSIKATLESESETWSEQWTSTTPDKEDDVELTVTAANGSTLNLDAAVEVNALTVKQGYALKMTGNNLSASTTTINADTDVSEISASLGAVTIASGKTLTISGTTTFTSIAGQGTVKVASGTLTLSGSGMIVTPLEIAKDATVVIANGSALSGQTTKITGEGLLSINHGCHPGNNVGFDLSDAEWMGTVRFNGTNGNVYQTIVNFDYWQGATSTFTVPAGVTVRPQGTITGTLAGLGTYGDNNTYKFGFASGATIDATAGALNIPATLTFPTDVLNVKVATLPEKIGDSVDVINGNSVDGGGAITCTVILTDGATRCVATLSVSGSKMVATRVGEIISGDVAISVSAECSSLSGYLGASILDVANLGELAITFTEADQVFTFDNEDELTFTKVTIQSEDGEANAGAICSDTNAKTVTATATNVNTSVDISEWMVNLGSLEIAANTTVAMTADAFKNATAITRANTATSVIEIKGASTITEVPANAASISTGIFATEGTFILDQPLTVDGTNHVGFGAANDKTHAVTLRNDITAYAFQTGNGRNVVETINQEGGTITLTGELTACNTTTAATVVLGHWPSSVHYYLKHGQLLAEGGALCLGWDAGKNYTSGAHLIIGQSMDDAAETTALASFKKITTGTDRNNTASIAVNPSGTLRVGEGGIDLPSNKSFTLAGGTLEMTATSAITLAHENGLNLTADSTIAVAANATVTAGKITGTGSLVKDGSGTLDLANATLPDTLAYTVTEGTLILPAGKEGAITVSEGATLKLCGASTLGSGTINVDGTLVYNTSAAATPANTFTGSGTITADGCTLDLAKDADIDDFTGTFAVANGGTIILPAGKEGNITVADGCTLKLVLNAEQLADKYESAATGTVTFVKVVDGEYANVTEGVSGGSYFNPEVPTWTPISKDSSWTDKTLWTFLREDAIPTSGAVIIDASKADFDVTAAISKYEDGTPPAFTSIDVKGNLSRVTSVIIGNADIYKNALTITIHGRVMLNHLIFGNGLITVNKTNGVLLSDVTFSTNDATAPEIGVWSDPATEKDTKATSLAYGHRDDILWSTNEGYYQSMMLYPTDDAKFPIFAGLLPGENTATLNRDTWMNIASGNYSLIAGGNSNTTENKANNVTGDIWIEMARGVASYLIGGNWKDALTDTNAKASITGNITVVVRDDARIDGSIFGGSSTAMGHGTQLTGNTHVVVKNIQQSGTGAAQDQDALKINYIGGGDVYVSGASPESTITGNTKVTIDLTSLVGINEDTPATFSQNLVGGSTALQGGTGRDKPSFTITGNSAIEITAPNAVTFDSEVITGGSYVYGTGSMAVGGNSSITLNGGTYKTVVAGSTALGGGTATDNSVTMTLQSGVFTGATLLPYDGSVTVTNGSTMVIDGNIDLSGASIGSENARFTTVVINAGDTLTIDANTNVYATAIEVNGTLVADDCTIPANVTITGNGQITGTVTIDGDLTFEEGTSLNPAGTTLTVSGAVTATGLSVVATDYGPVLTALTAGSVTASGCTTTLEGAIVAAADTALCIVERPSLVENDVQRITDVAASAIAQAAANVEVYSGVKIPANISNESLAAAELFQNVVAVDNEANVSIDYDFGIESITVQNLNGVAAVSDGKPDTLDGDYVVITATVLSDVATANYADGTAIKLYKDDAKDPLTSVAVITEAELTPGRVRLAILYSQLGLGQNDVSKTFKFTVKATNVQ